jgi:hypothetical protein
MINPLFKNGLVDGVFHLKKADIPEMVKEYVSQMETQRTNDWCKCEWIIHPDDVELDIHNCANCHHPRIRHIQQIGTESISHCNVIIEVADGLGEGVSDYDQCPCVTWIDPPKRRMRKGDQNPECPVHTKEGFLLGFFEWVFKDKEKDHATD